MRRSTASPTLPAAAAVLVMTVLAATALAVPSQAQTASTASGSEEGPIVDEIVAVVNNEVVLRSEVEGQFRALMQRQRQQPGPPPAREAMWNQVLQSRIDNQVMAAHARRDTTISAPDSRVQQVLDRRIQSLTQRAGGREALERAYGKSINELRADFEDPVRDQMLAQEYQRRRLDKVRITPSEVREWFAEIPRDSLPMLPSSVELSHIVRRPQASASAQRQAREVIGAIRDSVAAGVPIEEMARRYSDDQGSASQGGQIRQSLSQLVPSFAAVVSRAPLGEVTEVFKTRFGYHIARVNDRSGSTVDFNHVLIEVDRSNASGEEARAYLSAVRDSIADQGAPFGLMARRHSEEERSATQGGRVTDPQSGESTLRLDQLGPTWKSTIGDLDEGEVSQPAEVNLLNGERAFHLVKLTKRTPRHRMSLEQDYARVKQYALEQKQRRIYQQWVRQLREDVYVDVRADPSDLSASAQ